MKYELVSLNRKRAANFGGTEEWWEIELRDEAGRVEFATGQTEQEAAQRAVAKFSGPTLAERMTAPTDKEIPF